MQDEIKRIVLLLTTALLIGVETVSAAPLRDATRPNIIVILGDDVGWGDLGSYGASKIQTPNLDRLAHEGMRFTDAHASAAVCTPSRFSLLTGEYSWRHDVHGLNKAVADGNSPLLIKPGTVTLPSILKAAGYHTGIVGKWHLGFGVTAPDYNKDLKPGPLEVGFEEYFGYPATNDRVPPVYVHNHRVINLDPADHIEVTYTRHPNANFPHGSIVAGHSRYGWMTGGKAALWNDETMGNLLTTQAA